MVLRALASQKLIAHYAPLCDWKIGSAAKALPRHVKDMANLDSRVTVHMAASLDGFSARKDGRVDWLETSEEQQAAASRGDWMGLAGLC